MIVEVGKRYQHYKNKKEYIAIALGYFTESDPLLECVVYQAQYDDDDLGEKPVFIRPREMFEQKVLCDGKIMDRFTVVD